MDKRINCEAYLIGVLRISIPYFCHLFKLSKMKHLSTLIALLIFKSVWAQDVISENRIYRIETNKEFADSATSPLTEVDRKKFDSLHYFPIDEKYAVMATLKLTPKKKPFKMQTSTDRLADYRQYGIATFSIDGQQLELRVYQNMNLLKIPRYKNYLFIPFNDWTNGEETYPGGRYVEASITDGDSLLIDFNKAYNPYCAYNERYSCPIPPKENNLEIRIEAGVLKFH